MIPFVSTDVVIITASLVVAAAGMVERCAAQGRVVVGPARWTLWFYRSAGIVCLVGLFMAPIAYGQTRRTADTEPRVRASDIALTDVRVTALEAKLMAIEALRVDARLSVLEQLDGRIGRIEALAWSTLGGLALMLAGLVVQLRGGTVRKG